jgi:hypothetical protein
MRFATVPLPTRTTVILTGRAVLEIELWDGLVSLVSQVPSDYLTYIDNWTLLLATSTSLEDAHSASREIFASNAYLSPDFICQR